MKNLFNKFGLMALSVVGVAGSMALGHYSQAAADTDLTASLASTTAIITDNKGVILSFIVGALLAVFIIALSIRGLKWVFGMILGLFGKHKR